MTAAVEPSLFATLDPPRLAGSKCDECGTVAFPVQAGCARCAGSDLTTVELADHGTLWTYTIQAFEPKPPYRAPDGGFVPYGVGYVDLGEVIVESLLIGDTFTIGDTMRLTLLEVPSGVTYAFEKSQ